MNIKTILVPTDFSAPSRHALELATLLAKDHNAKIVVAYVMEPPPVYGEGQLAYSFEDVGVEEARRQLALVVPSDAAVSCEHKLLRGDASAHILRAAEETAADLIVMGTHGRTGLAHLLMGSVAEAIVRRAACPVLTVKQPRCNTVPTRKDQP
jgi:nucleotide-binding universal stress UspA family protein